MWERCHYRFGLAGEGQADIIQEYLERDRGRVLYVGGGARGDPVNNLSLCCDSLVVVDRYFTSLEMVRNEARPSSTSFVMANALSLPFSSGSFHHVLALGLFAHIRDGAHAMSEFHRVCRPKGSLMITNAVRHPEEHYRELGSGAGFQVLRAEEGYCPAASGNEKRRYLIVFVKPEGKQFR